MKKIISVLSLVASLSAFAAPDLKNHPVQIVDFRTKATITSKCVNEECTRIQFIINEDGAERTLPYTLDLAEAEETLRDRALDLHIQPPYFLLDEEAWGGWGIFPMIMVTVLTGGAAAAVIGAIDIVAAPFEGLVEGFSAADLRITANKISRAMKKGQPIQVLHFRFEKIVSFLEGTQ